jgi:hypothetical protein
MSAISPVAPIAHSFEWDAKRGRIKAIRFHMDDGSVQCVAAASADIPDCEYEPRPGSLLDVLVV